MTTMIRARARDREQDLDVPETRPSFRLPSRQCHSPRIRLNGQTIRLASLKAGDREEDHGERHQEILFPTGLNESDLGENCGLPRSMRGRRGIRRASRMRMTNEMVRSQVTDRPDCFSWASPCDHGIETGGRPTCLSCDDMSTISPLESITPL